MSNQTGRLPSTADRLELDVGLTASPPEESVHEAVHVEVCSASEHVVAGAAEVSGEDAECLAFAVLGAEAVDVLLAAGVLPEKEDSGLTEGPLEMGVADLGAGGADNLAARGLLALDETSIGHESLDALEARCRGARRGA